MINLSREGHLEIGGLGYGGFQFGWIVEGIPNYAGATPPNNNGSYYMLIMPLTASPQNALMIPRVLTSHLIHNL